MTTVTDITSFRDLGVDERLCAALDDAGITVPFPIQELTLPLALSGADVIGQARTGTGKTLAFGLPLLQRVDPADPTTQALVIVPTRELCLQVRDDLAQAGAVLGISVVAVYGGKAIDEQVAALAGGAPVVVGTPGRLLDLLRRGSLTLTGVRHLVLDEADEMLDLGFLPDVERLIEACAPHRQTLLFSATMPAPVVALARRYMHKPTFLRAEVAEARIAPETEQYFFSCHRMDKPAVLARILQAPGRGLCVVFTRTKRMADVLAEELREYGIKAAPIHSNLRQDARERALERFRAGTIDVLVATEVAARGLDITDVTHVVNYDCPDDEKMYLHRIGRTGRAGAAGVAITLAVWNELARLEVIKKALGIDAPTHEVFSTSPLLDELFALPPRQRREPEPAPRRRREPEPAPRRRREPEPAPSARAAAEAPRPRARRRGRRTAGGAAPAAAPADTASQPQAAAAPPPATADAAGQPRARVRVRTRARTRATAGDATQDTVAAAGRPGPATPDPGATGGAQRRRRPSSRRGRTAPSGRQDRRRAADRAAPAEGSRRPAPPNAAAARGDGRPLLRRRLVIERLP